MPGLGFVNPELLKARKLALMNGSTLQPGQPQPAASAPPPPSAVQQLPMPPMGGQGGPPPPQSVQPLPMPAMDPAQSQAPPAYDGPPVQDGAPEWTRIAGAIGHIILSADAGYHGRAMPAPPEGAGTKDQDQEMQVQYFLTNTVARAWEAVRNAAPEQRDKIIGLYSDAIRKVDPTFDLKKFMDEASSDSDWVDRVAPDVATMSDEAQAMFMAKVRQRGGDPATAAADVVKDQEFMKSLQDFDDRRNSPVLKYKLQRIRAAMVSMGMDPDTFAGMSMDDFARVNAELPEKARLSPSEMSTMRRHPDLAAALGMTTPSPEGESGPTSEQRPTGLEKASGYTPPSRPSERRPPAARQAPTEDAARPPPSPRRPANAPPRPAAPAPRNQQGPQTRPAPPATPKKQAPYYPPGWNPRTPKRPTAQQPAAPPRSPTPAPRTPEPASAERRVVASRDVEVPGVGKVKKGEVVIYDSKTGKYRRAS
jgi:hypothetical protein